MDYHILATLIRDSATLSSDDPMADTHLAARAAELGVSVQATAHLRRLWTAQGWLPPGALQDDVATAVIWVNEGDQECSLPLSPQQP